MINEIKKQSIARMNKAIENYNATLNKIRTGRIHSGLLDHLRVDHYGNMTAINQVASVTVNDAKSLTVQPWEAKMLGVIEKVIRDSDLGLNPITSGNTIKVPMPALTESRRVELIKVVKAEGEEARVSIRNIRRDANNELKRLLKEKSITEDDDKRAGDEIQKLTDKSIVEIDKLITIKEKELLKI